MSHRLYIVFCLYNSMVSTCSSVNQASRRHCCFGAIYLSIGTVKKLDSQQINPAKDAGLTKCAHNTSGRFFLFWINVSWAVGVPGLKWRLSNRVGCKCLKGAALIVDVFVVQSLF